MSSKLPSTPKKNWEPDSSSTVCKMCNAQFSIWTRRHHCRSCGKLACSGCTCHTAMVEGSSFPERVCVACKAGREDDHRAGDAVVPATADDSSLAKRTNNILDTPLVDGTVSKPERVPDIALDAAETTSEADPLFRALNSSEEAWLAQSSNICLISRLSSAAARAATDAALASALAVTRTQQPYLNVCIDAQTKRFVRITQHADHTSEDLNFVVESDNGSDGLGAAARACGRAQLAVGIDRGVSLARCHVGRHAESGATYLVLVCDHLAMDARSLVIWAEDLTAALVNGEESNDDINNAETMLPFVDWTERIPPVTLPPFAGQASVMLAATKAVASESLATAPPVVGLVHCIAPAAFEKLRIASKARGATLNAPLMTAFLAAVVDAARGQDPSLEAAPQHVRSVCAVDLRCRLTPPLDVRYMNNSASVAPVSATFRAATAAVAEKEKKDDLWKVAQEAQAGLMEAVAGGEQFRLQDITRRGAFAEMGPIFAIPCLWSNVGHVGSVVTMKGESESGRAESEEVSALVSAEVLVAGAGSNPVISGHVVEAGGALALTVTYAPAFHDAATAELIVQRFEHHVCVLGNSTGTEGNDADDARLAGVLPELLPTVLQYLDNPETRLKAVELLNHLSKRVRPNLSLPLPVFALARVATQPNASSFQRNFAAAYLEMAASRLTTPRMRGQASAAALGALAATDTSIAPAFGAVEASLCAVALHTVCDINSAYGNQLPPHGIGSSDENGIAYSAMPPPLLDGDQQPNLEVPSFDATRVVDFLLDVLLAPPLRPDHIAYLTSPDVTAPSAVSSDSVATSPATVAWPIPAGLSPRRLRRLCGKTLDAALTTTEAWSSVANLKSRKLAVLNFLPPRGRGVLLVPRLRPLNSSCGISGDPSTPTTGEWCTVCLGPGDALPLLLVASVDSSGAVAEAGSAGLALLRSSETARSALVRDATNTAPVSPEREPNEEPLLREDERVAETLLAFFLGDPLSVHGGPRSPLTPNMRSAILRWLLNDCPTGLARAGAGPLPLRVVQESLFGDHGSLALRSDGAALAHFLAARVDTQDHVKPGGGDDTCCGRTDSPCEGYAILASVLVEAALKVLASARSYETIQGDASTAAISDRGAMRAGDLAERCCGVLATVANRSPQIACCARPVVSPDSTGGEINSRRGVIKDSYGLAVRSAATLFSLLATKSTASHLRTAAAEALHALAAAFASCRAEDKGLECFDSVETGHGTLLATLVPLRRLLWSMSKSSDYRARHCVVTWADQAAWSRGEPAATYLLSCLASDHHADVREAASHALEAIDSAEEASPSSEALPDRDPIASFVHFVNFAVTGGDGSPALHTLPLRARASVIKFAMTILERIRSIDAPTNTHSNTVRLSEVSPAVGAVLVANSSRETSFALISAALSSDNVQSPQHNKSVRPFLAAFSDLVASSMHLLDEAALEQQHSSDGDHTVIETVPSVVAANCLLLSLKACAQALQDDSLTGESIKNLWSGLPGTLLRQFAAQMHRFASLAGHTSEVSNASHLGVQSVSGGDSGSSQIGRAASDATAVALSRRCAEIMGVLAPFAPSVASEQLLVAATGVLQAEKNEHNGFLSNRNVAPQSNSATGARRSALVSALTSVGALAEALHASHTSLEKIKQVVVSENANGAPDAASSSLLSCENLARSVHRAVAAAGGFVGCNDTEVHLAAAYAITRSANFNVPLPSLGVEEVLPSPAPESAISAPPSPALQYSSIEAAAAAGDRAAVRSLMQHRDGATPASEPLQSQVMGFGAGWIGDLWQKCATLANTHAEDTQRAGAAAAVLATAAASPSATTRSAAISALLATANRNDPDFAFAVGFALAAHALASPVFADNELTEDRFSPVGGVLVLDAVLRGPMQDSSPMVRRNGATWLLAILVAAPPAFVALRSMLAKGISLGSSQTTVDGEVAAFVWQGWLERIPILQKCFLKLLLDRRQSELGKEVAALGLAATAKAAQAMDNVVYKVGGDDKRHEILSTTLLADLTAAFKKSDPSAAHTDAEPYPSRMSPLEPGSPDDGDGATDVVQGIEAGAARELLASLRQRVNDHQEARNQGGRAANRLSHADPIELLGALYQQVGSAASGEGLSSTGVYAELVDLAMGMGRPQLLYTFLAAVASHEVWQSSEHAKRCAKHCIQNPGSSSDPASTADATTIGPEKAWTASGDLLPRLFCLRFDPNPHSRQVMRRLWDTLLPKRSDQQAAVALRWPDVVSRCVNRATSAGKWREREAALGALAELCRRSGENAWDKFGPWIEALWQCALGGLDDVRESAKATALALAKELVRLTTRFVDLKVNARTAPAAVARLLPLLLRASTSTTSALDDDEDDGSSMDDMEGNREERAPSSAALGRAVVVMSSEGRAVAMAALVKVVESAGLALRPYAARVIVTVAVAVSELEPPALAYLQFHAEEFTGGSSGLEELRLSLAKQGPLASAFRAALALVDDSIAAKLVPELLGLLRRGGGLATRVTAATAVDSLCQSVPNVLRARLHSLRGEVPARKLLFLLGDLALSEHSPAVRKSFQVSLGNVARLAPPQSLRALLIKGFVRRYRDATLGDDGTKARAADAIAQVCRRAAFQVDRSAWPPLLSLAFVARLDPNTDRSAVSSWTTVWGHGLAACDANGSDNCARNDDATQNEATQSDSVSSDSEASFRDVEALAALAPSLVHEMCAHLSSRSWFERQAGAKAAAALCSVLGSSLHQSLVPVPQPLVAALRASLNQRSDTSQLEQDSSAASEGLLCHETGGSETESSQVGVEHLVDVVVVVQSSVSDKSDDQAAPMDTASVGRDELVKRNEEETSRPETSSCGVPASLCLVRALALCIASQHRCWDGKHQVIDSLAQTVAACGAAELFDSSAPSDWLIDPHDNLLVAPSALLRSTSSDDQAPLSSANFSTATNSSHFDDAGEPLRKDARLSAPTRSSYSTGDSNTPSTEQPVTLPIAGVPMLALESLKTARQLSLPGMTVLILKQLSPNLPRHHRRQCCSALATFLRAASSMPGAESLLPLVGPPLARYATLPGFGVPNKIGQLFLTRCSETGINTREQGFEPEKDVVLQCRAIDALGEAFPCRNGIQEMENCTSRSSFPWFRCLLESALPLLPPSSSPWTVRTALLSALTNAMNRGCAILPEVSSAFIEDLLRASALGLEDAKYTHVRVAAAKLLATIAKWPIKHGASDQSRLLPHRDVLESLVSSCLTSKAASASPSVAEQANMAKRALEEW